MIEKMGHLEREDAAFLRDAATFYRAIDHGLRVATRPRRRPPAEQSRAAGGSDGTGAPLDAGEPA